MTRKFLFWTASLMVSLLFLGCDTSADDGDDDPFDEFGSDTDTNGSVSEDGYLCIGESDEVDTDACGPYPEEEGWDLDRVVTNITFDAYYDRDCDGEPEATTLNMYRDIYCNRDKVKSLVLIVGSNCGEEQGAEP